MHWFRMYARVRSDPKIQTLSGKLTKAWLNFMCFASEHSGYLPTVKEMAWELRSTESRVTSDRTELIGAGLIEDRPEGFYMHDWNVWQFESDSSTERVREHRRKQKEAFLKHSGNVSRNGHETASEYRIQNTETEDGVVSDFEAELDAVSGHLHGRHPPHRRCSVKMIKAKLRVITKKLPDDPSRIAKLKAIDLNHAAWCAYWAKDGGTYAKALENWLAPTMGRFDEEPPVLFSPAADAPRRLLL